MSDREKLLAVYAIFAAIVLILFSMYVSSKQTVTFTVEEKIVKRYSDMDRYLVFTDKGVFQNSDSVVFWKFDSSDIHGKLKPGHTYQATVVGWRVRSLSWYPNIITIKEVKQ